LTPSLDTHVLIGAFVDELGRCGVTDACTSPGSRCAPLVLALARDGALRAHSHIDERSAGFFALGLAKASGRPVAIACTSGTAAANLAPAVIEASEARVPLIVLTADRPPELREVGAGQTIDQIKLYGDAVRWFFEVGTHDATPERLRWIRTLGCRAVAEATGERPGPVHLNWALREPLVPGGLVAIPAGRADGRPWVFRDRVEALPGNLAAVVDGSARGVFVAGASGEGLHGLPALAEACGYPLLSDPMSGARTGTAAIAHYDLLLRDDGFAAAHAPEVVIRVGDLPTSKPLRTWLGGLERARQIAIDPQGAWQDPAGVLERSLRFDPAQLSPPASAPSGWLDGWLDADKRVAGAIADVLGDETFSELAIARLLGERLPAESTLFVASSMPVREIETVWPARADPPRVLANRGANGIDGTLSSAFGARAAGGPVCALVGDVAFAHDVGGLLSASRLGLAVTFVLIDNGGGAIFDHLPISSETDVYETHIATPTGIDFEALARAYSLDYVAPASLADVESVISKTLAAPARSIVVHIRVAREASLALNKRLVAAARAA
jgi:2-succinyl-5-enolpyruvyl-6-hydroxy-3-cyclohexene-1-carboxylate synthase